MSDKPEPANPYQAPAATTSEASAGGKNGFELQPDEQLVAEIVFRPQSAGGISCTWTDRRVFARHRGFVGWVRLEVPLENISSVSVTKVKSVGAWITALVFAALALLSVIRGMTTGDVGTSFVVPGGIAAALILGSQNRYCLRIQHREGVFQWRQHLMVANRAALKKGMGEILAAARATGLPVEAPPGLFEEALPPAS